MTQIKAFLGGPDSGIASLRPDLYESDRRFLMAESVHEASRILAVSEPWARWDNDPRQPLAVTWYATERSATAVSALAESLSYFLSSEVR